MKLLVLILFISTAFAQEEVHVLDFNADLDLGTRYDNIDRGAEEDRLQGSIRIKWELDTNGTWKFKGIVSTGGKFSSRWCTAYDFQDSNASLSCDLDIRQIYFQQELTNFKFQLGIIPPVKGVVSGTGLDSDGWIEGARIEIGNKEDGIVEVVAGSLTDIDNADPFSRDREFNYLELEISYPALKRIMLEAGIEKIGDDSYIKGEFRLSDIEIASERAFDIALEGLRNIETSSFGYQASLRFDLLQLLLGKFKDRVRFELEYNYFPESIGVKGELTNDFYRYGHNTIIWVGGAIDKNKRFYWFGKAMLNEEPRTQFGLEAKF